MSKNDQVVLDLITKTESKQKKLGKVKKVSWATTCSLSLPEEVCDNTHLNIQVCPSVEKLVSAYAYLIRVKDSYDEAAQALRVKDHQFIWSGFFLSEWHSDIQQRVNIIQQKEEINKLNNIKERLKGLTSEEQKRDSQLKELSALLE